MKRCKQFLLGFLLGALIFGSISVFADVTEIKAFLSDIKLSLNGQAIELEDINGEKIMPIVYNGTTYLPVKPIAVVLGMEVKYNESTNTVEITKKTGGDNIMADIVETGVISEWPFEIIVVDDFKIREYKDGQRYIMPEGVGSKGNGDPRLKFAGGEWKIEYDKDKKTVDFYKLTWPNSESKKEKLELVLKDIPVIYRDSAMPLIPYDTYINDILPKLLEALKTE